MQLVLSCEHGVNTLPLSYQNQFADYSAVLHTHQAIDFGALSLAKQLSQFFDCQLIQASTSRLLIDCNRSLSHRHCFSAVSRQFQSEQKKQIIASYYLPFREEVEGVIRQAIANNLQVLHLSIHSFVPELKGLLRNADLGLLYDPKREAEKLFARRWLLQLKQNQPTLRVRLNYPYRGSSDGFTTTLRRLFSPNDYLGLEIESNQALLADEKNLPNFAKMLAETLQGLLL